MRKSVFRLGAGILPLVLLFFFSCNNSVDKYINDEEVLRWEPDIHVFDSLDAIEPSGPETLLVTGSSSIRLWDSVKADLAPFRIIHRGYGGAKLSDFNYYADRIIEPHDYKAILLFVANDIHGGNDGRTPKEMFLLYKKLADKVLVRNPNTPLFWIETTPTPSRWHVWDQASEANRMIREYSEDHGNLHFIATSASYMNDRNEPDSSYFREDMLHMNPSGYALWTELILDALDEAGIEP